MAYWYNSLCMCKQNASPRILKICNELLTYLIRCCQLSKHIVPWFLKSFLCHVYFAYYILESFRIGNEFKQSCVVSANGGGWYKCLAFDDLLDLLVDFLMRFWFCMQAQIQSLQQQQQQHNSTLLPTQMVSMPQQQPPLGVVTSPQALSPASTPPIPPQNSQLPTPQSSAHQIPRQLSLSSTTSSSENGQ